MARVRPAGIVSAVERPVHRHVGQLAASSLDLAGNSRVSGWICVAFDSVSAMLRETHPALRKRLDRELDVLFLELCEGFGIDIVWRSYRTSKRQDLTWFMNCGHGSSST